MSLVNPSKRYPAKPAVHRGELPDLFALPGGGRVSIRSEWPECAQRWREMVLEIEYGGLPPKAETDEIETLCHSTLFSWPTTPKLWSYRVWCHGGKKPVCFGVRILFPGTGGPFPVIANGDGCWWYLSEEIARSVLESGCALALFNRTELAEDLGYAEVPDKNKRGGGLYGAYPGRTFGALSAWAWGYHRCVDLLRQLPFIDGQRIAVSGHSRGGKAALLAGATDERIALVNDNASCAGGSAAFHYVGDGGETLDIVNVFPSWFGPELRAYAGREEALPFDQHCLLAAIAPRPLLLTYALDDRWSNPEGMVQCAWAAREAYRLLGAPDGLAFHFRQGTHSHSLEDWKALLDFIGWKWQGKTPGANFNQQPYEHLQPAFSWRAPGI